MKSKLIFYVLLFLAATSPFSAIAQLDPMKTTFSPCPKSPNCISTAEGKIAPLSLEGSEKEMIHLVKQALATLQRGKIVVEENSYMRVEFTSNLFKFVDDLEVIVDEKNHLVHCKSASRTGWSDFGVNQKRVEQLFGAIQAQAQND